MPLTCLLADFSVLCIVENLAQDYSTQQLCPLALLYAQQALQGNIHRCVFKDGHFVPLFLTIPHINFSMNALRTTACVSFVAEADQSQAKIFQKQYRRARHFIGALVATCSQRRRWFALDFARQRNETSPQTCGDAKNVPAETPSQQGRRRNLQLRILSPPAVCTFLLLN